MRPKRIEILRYNTLEIQDFSYSQGRLRKIKTTWKDDIHGTQTWSHIFNYDHEGRLAQVSFPGGGVEFKYDAGGHLVEERLSENSKLRGVVAQDVSSLQVSTYEYDASGTLKGRKEVTTWSNGREQTYLFGYRFDAQGRLVTMENLTDEEVFAFDYSELNDPLSSLKLPACFLNNYRPASLLAAKIARTQGSPLTNQVIRQSADNYPLEITQIDWNGLKANLTITYQ